jgi:hypothetical protein
MKSVLARISLLSLCLLLLIPAQLEAASDQRTALLIGNNAYSTGPLKNPINDATAMAAQLEKLGFTVILKKNANLRTMEEALKEFGRRLKRGGVGLFFYAGHGLQVSGVNYLVPIGARITQESDIKYETLDAGKALDEMANANNGLNIVILDACRDNPFPRGFRNVSRGLAIISNAPAGMFISYSTGPGQVAREGEGKNSPYTEALLENIGKPGLNINTVFMNVRRKVKKETGQIPWELSSLEGEFFFVPGGEMKAVDNLPSGKVATDRDEFSPAKPSSKDASDDEVRELERRERLAGGKKQVAVAVPPSVSELNEVKRDGRFVAYEDGTVLDTQTNLIWAPMDNGFHVSWSDAKSYCESYRGGGYKDWRMPTKAELASLYDTSIRNTTAPTGGCFGGYHLTNLIHLTCCCAWASDSDGAFFNFTGGIRRLIHGSHRVLPVRSAR